MASRFRRIIFIPACLNLALALVLAACTIAAPKAAGTPLPAPAVNQAQSPSAEATPAPKPGGSQAPVAPRRSNDPGSIAAAFDEQRAMEHVRVLAQPEFMGRHSGTPGEVMGARYLAEQFRGSGLEPAGRESSYFQDFPMTVTELSGVPELVLVDESGRGHSLRLRDDFRPLIGGKAGPGMVEGPGVFAGTGDFSAVDVIGKVAVVLARGRLGNIIDDARNAGALGLILPTGQETLIKGEAQEPPAGGGLPVFLVSAHGSEALLEGSGHTRDEINQRIRAREPVPAFPLAFNVRLGVQVETHPITATNVLGFLPSANPTEESCMVGAHYEEIGPDPDGVVYPAANDNASGTAVMLEMARLLGEQAPLLRANVLFVGWSGHEEGLLGSAFYLDNPVFPVAQTKCYINLDTVGQGGGKALEAEVPDGRLRSALETALDRLEAGTGVRPPVEVTERSSGDSDHVNFVDRGVPAIAFNWTGIFQGGNIHVPADDADNVDPNKLKVTGQVATAVLLGLAGESQ